MNDKCKGRFGGIRCNFSPRYDVDALSPDQIRALAFLANVEVQQTRRYICDVCTACGEKRATESPSEGRGQ